MVSRKGRVTNTSASVSSATYISGLIQLCDTIIVAGVG